MTAIEQAIKEAIEKGGFLVNGTRTNGVKIYIRKANNYNKHSRYSTHILDGLNSEIGEVSLESIFLDPLFWQALGKARGWGNGSKFPIWSVRGDAVEYDDVPYEWQNKMLQFTYHLAEGKDAESFFATL